MCFEQEKAIEEKLHLMEKDFMSKTCHWTTDNSTTLVNVGRIINIIFITTCCTEKIVLTENFWKSSTTNDNIFLLILPNLTDFLFVMNKYCMYFRHD